MTVTTKQSHDQQGFRLPERGSASLRHICLLVGALTSMLAVGGMGDIALAAWIAPIFLLRFLRDSSALLGLSIIWLISAANCAYSQVQLGIPLELSWVFVVINGTIFTLPYLADRVLASRLGLMGKLLVFPAAYVSIEWMLSTLTPLGQPSGLRAATQMDNLPLLQVVSVAGPYSIAFLINWLATTANMIWEDKSDVRVRRAALLYGVVLALALLGGAARLAFTAPEKTYVRMAGITPSKHAQQVARAMILGRADGKAPVMDSAALAATTGLFASKEELGRTKPAIARAAHMVVHDDLIAGTREAARAGAKVVIWSETAASISRDAERQHLLAKAAQVAREEKIYLDVAIGQPFARNETHLIGPDGTAIWAYDKNNPVPVIEPIRAGITPVPVAQTPFGRLSNVICFDADFPNFTRINADIMMVPGFDWPEVGRMHTLKLARLRAIENGYSLIRIAYDSQSAAFDRFGNVLATQDTTGPDRHILYADVPTKGSRTLYNMTGDILAWLSLAGLAVGFVVAIIRRKRA